MACVMEGQEGDVRCDHSCIREGNIVEKLAGYLPEVQAQLCVELSLLRCQGIDHWCKATVRSSPQLSFDKSISHFSLHRQRPGSDAT